LKKYSIIKEVYTLKTGYSSTVLNYIKKHYPHVKIKKNDLRKGINELSGQYDTVICIRTLENLKEKDIIIKEMLRIAKKNAYIIFNMPTPYTGYTKKFLMDSYFFVRFIKTNKIAFKIFNSKYNIIPIAFYTYLEKIFVKISNYSNFYIIKKS